MYLLDTCVFSEFVRSVPEPKVVSWAKNVPESDQYLSAMVLGELLHGAERLPDGDRKDNLRAWIEGLFETHRQRILGIDAGVVRIWARICSDAEAVGRPPKAIDSLIAATAMSRDLVLVTRNEEDFRYLGVSLLNPWS